MSIEEIDTPAIPDRPLLPPAKVDSLKAISREELLEKIESGEIQPIFCYLPSRPLGPEPLNIDTTQIPLTNPNKLPERAIKMKILNRLNNSFKDKQEITLDLDNSRLHAIVGQNCSGKTYVLKTIALEFSGSYHRLSFAGLSKNVETIPWSVAQEQIQSDGSYLCNVLDYLSENAPNDFKLLQKFLTRIIPSIEGVSLHRFGNHTQIELKTKNIANIKQASISNGCLLTIGILAILLNPRQPNLILIDDIDQALHSTAQRELIEIIKEIVEFKPELQVIVSTHSPYVVDELTQSQVHILRSLETGEITCKRLDCHPDAEWAKQTLTTGEFWDSVGEDW